MFLLPFHRPVTVMLPAFFAMLCAAVSGQSFARQQGGEPSTAGSEEREESKKAFVIVVTQPSGARVFVDGKLAGESTLALHLDRGRTYEISIERPGYLRFSTAFTPTRERQRLDVKLSREKPGDSNKPEHKAPPFPIDIKLDVRVGINTGLAFSATDDNDALPILMGFEFGPGLAIGNHVNVVANLNVRWIIWVASIQADLEAFVFPWDKNGFFSKSDLDISTKALVSIVSHVQATLRGLHCWRVWAGVGAMGSAWTLITRGT